jgi:hypothetical protein
MRQVGVLIWMILKLGYELMQFDSQKSRNGYLLLSLKSGIFTNP